MLNLQLAKQFKHVERLAVENSPALLTAAGVLGTIATAVLSGRSALRADRIIQAEANARLREARTPEDEIITRKEHFQITWKCYIPPATILCLTVAAIVGANRIGTRRAAAVATAMVVAEKGFEEYKAKVVEKIGEGKERDIRTELAQDRVHRNPSNDTTIIVTEGGKVKCYDSLSGRYFRSDMETIKKAVNNTNHYIIHHNYASLSDLYLRIGLPATAMSERVGWNVDRLIEPIFNAVMDDKDEPVMSLEFLKAPMPDFQKLI